MGKTDVVAAGVSAFQAAETQMLTDQFSAFYDSVVADVGTGTGGGFTQADIDSAVQAAQAVDAQALADAQAQAATDLAAVQQQLSDMTTKEQGEEQVVINLQQSVAAVQSSLDAIKSLIFPAPVTPVDSTPAPTDPTVQG